MPSLGQVIARQRKKNNWTQKQLADRLMVSDKAVSKWERDQGMPDISLLEPLARTLHMAVEELLSGQIPESERSMKHTCFYLCPQCGNLITGSKPAFLSCCGEKLTAMLPEQPESEHMVEVEVVEDEWYITTAHPMTKDHYITFVALVNGEQIHLSRQYPEQNLSLRFPKRGRGTLYYHCSNHGLFSIKLPLNPS